MHPCSKLIRHKLVIKIACVFYVRCGVFTDIECAKSYAKIAESAKTLASQQVSKERRLVCRVAL